MQLNRHQSKLQIDELTKFQKVDKNAKKSFDNFETLQNMDSTVNFLRLLWTFVPTGLDFSACSQTHSDHREERNELEVKVCILFSNFKSAQPVSNQKKSNLKNSESKIKLPTDNFRFTNRTILIMRLEEGSCVSVWKIYENIRRRRTNIPLDAAGFWKIKTKRCQLFSALSAQNRPSIYETPRFTQKKNNKTLKNQKIIKYCRKQIKKREKCKNFQIKVIQRTTLCFKFKKSYAYDFWFRKTGKWTKHFSHNQKAGVSANHSFLILIV